MKMLAIFAILLTAHGCNEVSSRKHKPLPTPTATPDPSKPLKPFKSWRT